MQDENRGTAQPLTQPNIPPDFRRYRGAVLGTSIIVVKQISDSPDSAIEIAGFFTPEL
ncbi:MAG: hypothetical protein V7727_13480 [Sneathiella sp.]